MSQIDMSQIKVLDCTLRDGGYYNEWDFTVDLVSNYLRTVDLARIDIVEIGFRFLPQPRFLGAFAYTTDDFLANLPLPNGLSLAVMINAKEMLQHPDGPQQAIDMVFQNRSDSHCELVRIAAHFSDLDGCVDIVEALESKGYRLSINLMQASERSLEELGSAARKIQDWGKVDILYFADSLGNMDSTSVQTTIRALRREWAGEIGIHAHNNKSQALTNSIAAIEAGATWIDATISGMGRGAGNTETEYLLLELKQRQIGDYYPEALFPLVLDSFEKLRQKHGWGPSLLYYLSGCYGIHPTYVQEMLGKGQYDTHDIIAALEFLKESGSTGYDHIHLEKAMLGRHDTVNGSWLATGWAEGQDVLLIGPGPGLSAHLDALVRFIERLKPLVVCLNANIAFPIENISVYAACHKARLLLDVDKYRHLRRPVVTPLGVVPAAVREKLDQLEVMDFGMKVEQNVFDVRPSGCTIPAPLVAPYAMALAEAGGASRILLAGFDGYGGTDSRQLAMNNVFNLYRSREKALPILAVTPTTYDVPKGSVYSPVFNSSYVTS